MNPRESLKTEIAQLLANLKSEAVEMIDFDRVTGLLESLQELLPEHEIIAADLARLKQDYRRRIVGMLKAVMAGRAKDGDAELATSLIDDNHPFGGRELIELYRKISARFRDCFPASFKYLAGQSGLTHRGKNWAEHKL